jgi:hypothetical protein
MHKIFTKLVGICIHPNHTKNTTEELGKMYLQIANQNLDLLLAWMHACKLQLELKEMCKTSSM